MARWVPFVKVRRMPAMLSETRYKTVGSFRRAVKTEAAGSATWARAKASTNKANDKNLEVDVTAIPGVVPALFVGGGKVS